MNSTARSPRRDYIVAREVALLLFVGAFLGVACYALIASYLSCHNGSLVQFQPTAITRPSMAQRNRAGSCVRALRQGSKARIYGCNRLDFPLPMYPMPIASALYNAIQ